MDTFTFMSGATALFLVYLGERFKTGAYLLNACVFVILYVWRMGEELFYIGGAALLIVLIYRAFTGNNDIRDATSETEGD